jgi:hypothetical protein
MLEMIISGGQTGADRAALDFAIAYQIPHGGWCPKGRLAEDGVIDEKYMLWETETDVFAERTEQNVEDSDGTAIFSIEEELTGGTLDTLEIAKKHNRPFVHICKSNKDPETVLKTFIDQNNIRILNVAGPRESKEPGIGEFVISVLSRVLS